MNQFPFIETGLTSQFATARTIAISLFFTLNGTWLAVYPRELLAEDATVPADGDGFSGVTLAHNVSTKGEVETILAQAEAAGGRIVKPAQDVFWGGYSGYFEDPDGHLWEIAYPLLSEE